MRMRTPQYLTSSTGKTVFYCVGVLWKVGQLQPGVRGSRSCLSPEVSKQTKANVTCATLAPVCMSGICPECLQVSTQGPPQPPLGAPLKCPIPLKGFFCPPKKPMVETC